MYTSNKFGTTLEPWIKARLRKLQKEHGVLKLGLNGGTFSPIHDGHLLVAQAAMEQFGLHAILWIPNGDPPHKPDALDKEHRIAMVKRATKSNRDFLVTRLEADRPGPSYTNLTIEQLRAELGPDVEFNLIFGADNVVQLSGWRGGQEYIQQCRLLVAARDTGDGTGGEREEILQTWRQYLPGYDLDRIDCPMHAISSTIIRELVAQGRSIEYYVPPPVNKYIRKNGLYQPAIMVA